MKCFYTCLCVIGISIAVPSYAQVTTINSGRWSAPSTWSTGIVPDASNTSITIAHDVTISSDTAVVVDNLMINATVTIEKDAELILSHDGASSADLTINTGALQVWGKLTCQDGAMFSGTSTSNTFFHDSAVYEHQYFNTAGEPPLATWATHSEMLITGYIFGKSLNSSKWNQSYGNITYDCAAQRSGTFVEMLGNIQHVKGSFVVKNTNSGILRFSLDKTAITTIFIGGDLVVEGNSEFWLGRNSNIVAHVGGDFVFRSTSTASTYLTTTGSSDVTVNGSVIINSTAPFRFASSGGGRGTLHVKKNFMLSQGNVTVLPIGRGELILDGTQPQTLHAGGTLTTGVNVTIDNTEVSITNNTKIGGNLLLTSGSKLFLPPTCSLGSNFEAQPGADIVHHVGTIHLDGNSNQVLNINGDTIKNLSISKPANTLITLTGNLNLMGNLAIQTSNTDVESNGYLTLLSLSDDGNADASIDALPNGSDIIGNVTVQRYMSGEGRIYRYISSPVQATTVADCKDDFPVTGNFQDPSTGSGLGTTSPSLFYYDETLHSNAGWIAYPASGFASENALQPTQGYASFIRRSNEPTVWDVTGVVNQHELTFSLTHTQTGDLLNDGWNLVGNPFPANIDWDVSDGWEKINVADKVAIKDNGTGMFQYWSEGIGSLEAGRIAKGQAFWIQTTGHNASLAINEKAKAISSTTFHRKKTIPLDYLEISLLHNGYVDKAYLRQKSETSFQVDESDVTKWTNDYFNISFPSDNLSLSIQNIAHADCQKLIPLRVYFAKDSRGNWLTSPHGRYLLEMLAMGTFSHVEIWLHDHFLKQRVLFDKPYEFLITDKIESANEDRFSLEIIGDTTISEIAFSTHRRDCNSRKFYIDNLQHGVTYTYLLNDIASQSFHRSDSTTFQFTINDSLLVEGNNHLEIYGRTACATRKLYSLTFQNIQDRSPQIQVERDFLKVSAPGKKQWFLDGVKLEGDSLSTCKITRTGLYELEIANEGCVLRASHLVKPVDNNFLCFPNPTNAMITVIGSEQIHSVALMDYQGRLISIDNEIQSERHLVNVQTLAKGLYVLLVSTGSKSEKIKIVKID